MYAKGRRQIRRSNIKRLPLQVVSLASLLCLLFVVYSGFQPTRLSGGDNIDALSGGEIFDRFWDPRLFNGVVVGYDGFIKWRYNDTGVPAEVPLVCGSVCRSSIGTSTSSQKCTSHFSISIRMHSSVKKRLM